MTHYSREAFAEKYQISQGTLQNWETARFGGLTEKGGALYDQDIESRRAFFAHLNG